MEPVFSLGPWPWTSDESKSVVHANQTTFWVARLVLVHLVHKSNGTFVSILEEQLLLSTNAPEKEPTNSGQSKWLTRRWDEYIFSFATMLMRENFSFSHFTLKEKNISRDLAVIWTKIAPWSSGWFEEISVSLIWVALIWVALIWVVLCCCFFFGQNSYYFHSIFTTWELIWHISKWNKFDWIELLHIVSQWYVQNNQKKLPNIHL